MILTVSTTHGQQANPGNQAKRTDLLKRIWKVNLEKTNPRVYDTAEKSVGYKIVFADSAVRISSRRLDQLAKNAIMVMASIGLIDSTTTDSVSMDLYGSSDKKPAFSKQYGLAALLASFKTTADKVYGLFSLCPYRNIVYPRAASVNADISPSIDVRSPVSDCGYIGLCFSLIITKYFDGSSGRIQTLRFTWSDGAGQPVQQSFSRTDNSYLAQENAFL